MDEKEEKKVEINDIISSLTNLYTELRRSCDIINTAMKSKDNKKDFQASVTYLLLQLIYLKDFIPDLYELIAKYFNIEENEEDDNIYIHGPNETITADLININDEKHINDKQIEGLIKNFHENRNDIIIPDDPSLSNLKIG